MTKQGIAVGVIGAGSIAEIAHFPAIRDEPSTKLVAVCDTDKDRVKAAAKKWGAAGWYTDYLDMLSKEKLDLVIIATPNYLHFEQALATADAGAHAIIEKPMACTNTEAWDIVDAFKKKSLKVMVGCNQRFWLQHEIGKHLIEEGVIGDVKMGRSSLHEDWRTYQLNVAAGDFRVKPEETAAATLFDQGSHRVDLLTWLVGSPVKRVVGLDRLVANSVESGIADDAAWVLMEFENGAIGTVSTDKFSPVVSNITEIYGTEGTMFLSSEATNPFQSAPLAIYTAKDYDWDSLPEEIRDYRYPTTFWVNESPIAKSLEKRWVSIYPPRKWAYTRMLHHFIECVESDRECIIKPEDGAMTMEVLCGVFQSMTTNGWVDLPMPEEVIPPHYTKKRMHRQQR